MSIGKDNTEESAVGNAEGQQESDEETMSIASNEANIEGMPITFDYSIPLRVKQMRHHRILSANCWRYRN